MQLPVSSPATPGRQRLPLTLARVWAGPISLAATLGISLDFSSSGYLDVSVPRVVLLRPILFRRGCPGMTPGGFPHSETSGSAGVCPSPEIIAACRVLRRLPMPRHPPCALGIFFMRPPAPERSARVRGIWYPFNILLAIVYAMSMMRTTPPHAVIAMVGMMLRSCFAFCHTGRCSARAARYATVKVLSGRPIGPPGSRMLRIRRVRVSP